MLCEESGQATFRKGGAISYESRPWPGEFLSNASCEQATSGKERGRETECRGGGGNPLIVRLLPHTAVAVYEYSLQFGLRTSLLQNLLVKDMYVCSSHARSHRMYLDCFLFFAGNLPFSCPCPCPCPVQRCVSLVCCFQVNSDSSRPLSRIVPRPRVSSTRPKKPRSPHTTVHRSGTKPAQEQQQGTTTVVPGARGRGRRRRK